MIFDISLCVVDKSNIFINFWGKVVVLVPTLLIPPLILLLTVEVEVEFDSDGADVCDTSLSWLAMKGDEDASLFVRLYGGASSCCGGCS